VSGRLLCINYLKEKDVMKTKQKSKDIPAAAWLSPASLARLRKMARNAAARARAEGPLISKPPAEVKQALKPKGEINVTLHFVPMKEETVLKLSRTGDARKSRGPAERLRVSAEEIEVLRKAEPRLLKWIAESEENAVLFTANPLKALVEAGVELSAKQLLRLRVLRQRNLANVGPQPPSPITKIKVSAK